MLTFKIANGDISFSSATGRPLTLEGTDKFSQDIRENLENKNQANGTGADLDGMVAMIGDTFSIRAELSRRVSLAFDSLKDVQNATQKFDRADNERVSRVTQVTVIPLRQVGAEVVDQTSFAYRVDVISVAGGKPSSVSGQIVR